MIKTAQTQQEEKKVLTPDKFKKITKTSKFFSFKLGKMKVIQRLVLVFLTVSLVPLLFVSIFSFQSAKSAIKEQKISELETIVSLKKDKINTFFDTLKKDMETAQDYYNVKTNLPIIVENMDDLDSIVLKFCQRLFSTPPRVGYRTPPASILPPPGKVSKIRC